MVLSSVFIAFSSEYWSLTWYNSNFKTEIWLLLKFSMELWIREMSLNWNLAKQKFFCEIGCELKHGVYFGLWNSRFAFWERVKNTNINTTTHFWPFQASGPALSIPLNCCSTSASETLWTFLMWAIKLYLTANAFWQMWQTSSLTLSWMLKMWRFKWEGVTNVLSHLRMGKLQCYGGYFLCFCKANLYLSHWCLLRPWWTCVTWRLRM